ncbi:ABC transporter permease [Promicromonospora sp. NPDC057488]|uniref:ABC transporter permease n=1 Tax=Promicromonospora sp. NPDC057488 TaxID=3346147 RepID=UPI00366AD1D5
MTTTALPAVPALERPALALRGAFAGTGDLLRLALRRDRVLLPVQLAVCALLFVSTLSSVSELYGTQEQRDTIQGMLATNPAFLVLLGPYENTGSVASTVSWRVGIFMVAVFGVLAVMAVVRHTRKEEQLGRLELVRAARVGSLAPLVTGLVVGAIFAVVSGALTAAVVWSQGPPDGAVALGAQVVGVGLAASGIAAVTAQVASSSRGANSLGVWIVIGGYLLRGGADVDPDALGWLHWVTPVGWAQQIDPYGANDYLPFLLCVALFVVGGLAAGWLTLHRDLGAGLIAERRGPAHSASLTSTSALVARLTRSSFVIWAVSVGVYMFFVGYLMATAGTMVTENEQFAQYVTAMGVQGSDIAAGFAALIMSWTAYAGAGYGVTVVQDIRTEEALGRTEAVLATRVSRTRYLVAWLAGAIGGAVLLLGLAGLALGAGNALASGTSWGDSIADGLGAAVVHLPAVLVVIGLTSALYGWFPRLVGLGWAVIAASFLVTLLGSLLDLPDAVVDLSPFAHAPAVPAVAWSDVDWAPLGWLLLVAAAFLTLALAGFRRRDVPIV